MTDKTLTINDLPTIKDSKEKFKKTLLLSKDANEIYEKGKALKGIDTPRLCADAVEKAMLSIKHLVLEPKP